MYTPDSCVVHCTLYLTSFPVFSVLRFPLTICHPYASVYYCQQKPKNRKNGVGLGTRLHCITLQGFIWGGGGGGGGGKECQFPFESLLTPLE